MRLLGADGAMPDGLRRALRLRGRALQPGHPRHPPGYANWPTFPQLYVDGELVGGCDIITEMYQSGELEPLVKNAGQSAQEAGESATAE